MDAIDDESRVSALIDELRAFTGGAAANDSDVNEHPLVQELREKTGGRREQADTALLASVLPLLHRVGPGKLDTFLEHVAAASDGAGAELIPGEGAVTRRRLLDALGEDACVYFWLGHCAYAVPDPDLLLIWSSAAERAAPAGNAAPWDTAGLCTAATLGRNVATEHEAHGFVAKYSLPVQGAAPPLHRRYLAEVLACSFEHPDDYWQGLRPSRWYPGWFMDPPREAMGGSKEEMPHHTFEVRRAGKVLLTEGLLAVVASDEVLARRPRATRNLEGWARKHAVWQTGRRLHRVNTKSGKTVTRTAIQLVEQYLREEAAT